MTILGTGLDITQYSIRSTGLYVMRKVNEEKYQKHKSKYMHLFTDLWREVQSQKP